MYVICIIPGTLQPSTREFNLKWIVGSSWWHDFVWHHLRQRWCKLCFVCRARKPEILKLGLYHWWSRKLLKTRKVKWLNVLIMFFRGDWKTYWVNAGNFGYPEDSAANDSLKCWMACCVCFRSTVESRYVVSFLEFLLLMRIKKAFSKVVSSTLV